MNLIKKLNGTEVLTRVNDEHIIPCGVIIENHFYKNLYSKGIKVNIDQAKTIKQAWYDQDFDGNWLCVVYTDGTKTVTEW